MNLVVISGSGNNIRYTRYVARKCTNIVEDDKPLSAAEVEEFRANPARFLAPFTMGTPPQVA